MSILQVDSQDSLLKYIKLFTDTVGKRNAFRNTSKIALLRYLAPFTYEDLWSKIAAVCGD